MAGLIFGKQNAEKNDEKNDEKNASPSGKFSSSGSPF
jgi:hypothetical protein